MPVFFQKVVHWPKKTVEEYDIENYVIQAVSKNDIFYLSGQSRHPS